MYNYLQIQYFIKSKKNLFFALAKMRLSAMTYEGNIADERELDEVRTARMIDLFVTETLGLKKIAA